MAFLNPALQGANGLSLGEHWEVVSDACSAHLLSQASVV